MKKLILSAVFLMVVSTTAMADWVHIPWIGAQTQTVHAVSAEYTNVDTACPHRWCGG